MKHQLKHLSNHQCSSRRALVLGILLMLPLMPLTTWAHFTIEFTDGTSIDVTNYKEEGGTVKVYTHEGSFAFRKTDIAKIIDTRPSAPLTSPTVKEEKPSPEPKSEARPRPQNPTQALQQKRSSQPLPAISAELPSTAEMIHEAFTSLDFGALFQLAGIGLYRLRYIFAALIGAKVLKLFVFSSLR